MEDEDGFGANLNEKEINIPVRSKNSIKLATGIVILIIVLIVVISLLSLLINKSKSKFIGDIFCVYNITNENENIKLLGSKFKKTTKFDMYIDNIKIDYTKEYTFDKVWK